MPKPTLADTLSKQKPRNGGQSCVVCGLVLTLQPEDVEALNQALTDNRMSAGMIRLALEEHGYNVSDNTLRRHRRRECAALRA